KHPATATASEMTTNRDAMLTFEPAPKIANSKVLIQLADGAEFPRKNVYLIPSCEVLLGGIRRSWCQRKVEMSYSLQSRNVLFSRGGEKVGVMLPVPVKRRGAMLASNPIEE